MAYTITLSNTGGVLDTRSAETAEQAAAEAIRLIRDCGSLHTGDTITVQSDSEDDE